MMRGAPHEIAMLASLAAAAHNLQEQAGTPLRDTVLSLADDNQTVMIYANYHNDAATVFTSFMLPNPVAAEDFDAGYYKKLLEGGGINNKEKKLNEEEPHE